MARPILVIGLDGYEPSVAAELMARGRMPHLREFASKSAQFVLDHGEAKRTGLAWEHISLGREPAAYGRYAAVHFDPQRYEATQHGTAAKPFLADIDTRAVVFDAPYFDLLAAPNCRGLVSWGAHDSGIAPQCAPAGLFEEISQRFGPYPATPYIYGFVWPNPDRARAMADALVRAVDTRAAIGRWLCTERFQDWDIALIVVSEFHSAIEALWHGYDPAHPLHGHPSAAAARDGIVGVYEMFDRMLGDYRASMPQADIVLFSMHGMGANDSDVPTMLLLPELLYRARFGAGLFEPRPDWRESPDSLPMLAAEEKWSFAVSACLQHRDGAATRLGDPLGWMPAAAYRPYWPRMDAFALPSYYDGRIRINLAGREREGCVALADYGAKLDELCVLLRSCVNPRTGETVVRSIDCPVASAPLDADPTQADLVIVWRGAPLAFRHETFGLIGPAPFRRTGGHTGRYGIAYFHSPRFPSGELGVASSFDVVPTLIDLVGLASPSYVSGQSLLMRVAA